MSVTSNFSRFEGYILEKTQPFEYILMLNDNESTQVKIKLDETATAELAEGQFISCMGQAKNKQIDHASTETYFEVKRTC
jgi:hypothetical protein